VGAGESGRDLHHERSFEELEDLGAFGRELHTELGVLDRLVDLIALPARLRDEEQEVDVLRVALEAGLGLLDGALRLPQRGVVRRHGDAHARVVRFNHLEALEHRRLIVPSLHDPVERGEVLERGAVGRLDGERLLAGLDTLLGAALSVEGGALGDPATHQIGLGLHHLVRLDERLDRLTVEDVRASEEHPGLVKVGVRLSERERSTHG